MVDTPPKSDKDPEIKDETGAEDAIEDAEILEEPEADLDEPVAHDVAMEELETEAKTTDEVYAASDEGTPLTEDATSEEVVTPWAATNSEEASNDAPDAVASDEPPSEPPVETPAEPEKKGAAAPLFGFVLGGVVAAALGFGAAQYAGGGWPFASTTPEPDPLAGTVEQQAGQIAELRALVEANAQGVAGLEDDSSADDLRVELSALSERLTAFDDRLVTFDARISELEKMPGGDSAEAAQLAAEAYERELADMREMLAAELANLEARQAEAETLQVSAAEAAQAATARAALSRIMGALDSGQPFEDALFDVTQAVGVDAPSGLSAVAADGAPTLSELQASFPEVARAALDDSLRDMVANGEIGRGAAFLRTQLGTRSLEPQEGNDPDAILSRAEFALQNGRIDEALEELSTMPAAASEALAPWITQAETRAAALAAGAQLAADVNG